LSGAGSRVFTLDDVIDDALVLVPVTLFPSVADTLGESVKGCGELLGTVRGESEVVDADLRGPDCGPLEAVWLEALLPINSRRVSRGGTTQGVVGELAMEVRDGVVEESAVSADLTRVVLARGVAGGTRKVSPSKTNRVLSRVGWEGAFINQRLETIPNSFGEGTLGDEVKPRGDVDVFGVNIRTDMVSLLFEDGVDLVQPVCTCSGECRHSK
jgi:hypothetical protein